MPLEKDGIHIGWDSNVKHIFVPSFYDISLGVHETFCAEPFNVTSTVISLITYQTFQILCNRFIKQFQQVLFNFPSTMYLMRVKTGLGNDLSQNV